MVSVVDPVVSEAKSPTSSTRWRVGIALGILALVGALVWARFHSASGQERRRGAGQTLPVPVRVVRPEPRDVPIELEAVGTVTPLQTAVVRPKVDGELLRVLFAEGQDVQEGDLLAELDPRMFRVALAQSQAVLARDRASLVQARLTRERNRELHRRDLLSTQDLETQEATVAALEATEQADRAAVENARLSLSYARITAPISGRTGLRQIDPGNLVTSTDANGIVVITQVDPIGVLFSLPQDDVSQVATAMGQGELPVEVFSRDGRTSIGEGVLTVIDNRVDPNTGTFRLRARLPNSDAKLWASQLVTVRMRVTTRENVLTIPEGAVQHGPDGTFVYVVREQRARVRPVSVERTVGELALLSSGLGPNDVVVNEGQSRLRPDSEVRLQESSQPPDAGTAVDDDIAPREPRR